MIRPALVALALMAAGCSAAPAAMLTPTPTPTPALPRLAKAALDCGIGPRVQDKGASVFLDTKGTKDSSGDPMATVTCMLSLTDAPAYVSDHIGQTRALDGTQTDEWAGYKARWTYHPDAGLRLTIIDTQL